MFALTSIVTLEVFTAVTVWRCSQAANGSRHESRCLPIGIWSALKPMTFKDWGWGCEALPQGSLASPFAGILPCSLFQAGLHGWRRVRLFYAMALRWVAIRIAEDVSLDRTCRIWHLRHSRYICIKYYHRRSYRRTCPDHRAFARCCSYYPRNHLNMKWLRGFVSYSTLEHEANPLFFVA